MEVHIFFSFDISAFQSWWWLINHGVVPFSPINFIFFRVYRQEWVNSECRTSTFSSKDHWTLLASIWEVDFAITSNVLTDVVHWTSSVFREASQGVSEDSVSEHVWTNKVVPHYLIFFDTWILFSHSCLAELMTILQAVVDIWVLECCRGTVVWVWGLVPSLNLSQSSNGE